MFLRRNTTHIIEQTTYCMFPHTTQDESRSISENSTFGIRKKFEQGMVRINQTKFLGYEKSNLIINEKQEKIVRRIYKDYLDGKVEGTS